MDQDRKAFLRQFMTAQDGLYAYIRSRGFAQDAAEDLLQDAALELWQGFDRWPKEAPFIAWAIGVTKNLIRKKRRYDRVRSGTQADSEVIERIAVHVEETLTEQADCFAQERQHLSSCIGRLTEISRRVLALRYDQGQDLQTIAREIGRSYPATNMLLSRIRKALFDCISKASLRHA